jgi:hypothetical protein
MTEKKKGPLFVSFSPHGECEKRGSSVVSHEFVE